ncbi:OLC1v1036054C1 [Oldenlandia corymbosa var. corymbosa]|uniref:OLC1v1036054C1 n=1 Tax=Oldenlandia corymbosa var. corymbosa TaxID=529605 RepID=A0AAV1CUH1_OLDCO|nr:OLC1v1036054C1 [Oldenlandia corymbosa var. corymbosa]
MGKRSAFDDSNEEEQYPEERPQGTPQPEMGQAPPSQMMRARAESSRKRNPSGQTSGCAGSAFIRDRVRGLGGPAGFGQEEGHKRGQQGQRGGDAAPGLGRGERAPRRGGHRMKGQLKGMELTHSLQMESLLATSVPKSCLDAYILAGVQRYLGSSEFALGINDVMDPAMERGARKVVMEIEAARRKNEDIQPILNKYADREMKGKTSAVRLQCKARKHFQDIDFAHLPIMQQIVGTFPSVSKPEDILNIPGSPSFVFQMPRGTQTPPSTPPGPDEEPKIIASAPPPKGTTPKAEEEGEPRPTPTPTAETR